MLLAAARGYGITNRRLRRTVLVTAEDPLANTPTVGDWLADELFEIQMEFVDG
jgi:hypothetical protein